MAILSDEKSTPKALFDKINEAFHFSLDVCASEENKKCDKFYSLADDGLSQSWAGHTCWMNPPYSRGEMTKWLTKARDEVSNGVTTVALVMGDTSCDWYHSAQKDVAAFCFLKGRLAFNGVKTGARFPNHILLFMPEERRPTPRQGFYFDLDRFLAMYGDDKC